MPIWTAKAMRFADRFVPTAIQEGGDEDRLRDARTLVLVCFSMVVWGPPFAALTLGLGATFLPILIGVATVGVVGVPVFMRLTGSFPWAVRLQIFFLWEVLYGSALVTGGTVSPALFWLPSLPLVAMMLLGKREALIWALFTAACFLSLPIAEQGGVSFIQELSGGAFLIYWGACGASAVLVIASVGAAYELAKDRMKLDLQASLRLTDEALAGTRLVLDNVDEGLLILDPAGEMGPQASRAVTRLLGEPTVGAPFSELLAQVDPEVAAWWELGWESVVDGFLPTELAIAQLPSRVQAGECTLELRCQPVLDASGDLERGVVVVQDISAELAQERAQLIQQELLSIFQHLMRDPSGFASFLKEGRSLIAQLAEADADPALTMRVVHTLKGNAGLFSVRSVAEACHRVEEALTQGASGAHTTAEVVSAWNDFEDRLAELRGETRDVRSVLDADVVQLKEAIASGASRERLLQLLQGWEMEPVETRLGRFGEQAQALAERLGKPGLVVETDCEALRLNAEDLDGLWCAYAHAVRNAVDHGVEGPAQRLEAGKPAAGRLRLSAHMEGAWMRIALEDDGAGVNVDAVRARARDLGLPCTSEAELCQAVFHEGLSSRAEVSETSGRGVGLSALREVVHRLGGQLGLESRPGQGSTLWILLPASLVWSGERLELAA